MSKDAPSPFLASLTSAMGVEQDSFRVDSKKRGMSDVDDSNLMAL